MLINNLEGKTSKLIRGGNNHGTKRKWCIPFNWKKNLKCPHCKKSFEANVKDFSVKTKLIRNFFSKEKMVTLFLTRCSECNNEFSVPKDDLPFQIIDYICAQRDSDNHFLDFFISYYS